MPEYGSHIKKYSHESLKIESPLPSLDSYHWKTHTNQVCKIKTLANCYVLEVVLHASLAVRIRCDPVLAFDAAPTRYMTSVYST